MYVLDKLWRGTLSPSERFIHEDSAYWQISRKHTDALNTLYAMLSPEAIKQYEYAEQLALDMLSIDSEESFIQGFRLGARIILDTLTDYRGNFFSLAEQRNFEK